MGMRAFFQVVAASTGTGGGEGGGGGGDPPPGPSGVPSLSGPTCFNPGEVPQGFQVSVTIGDPLSYTVLYLNGVEQSPLLSPGVGGTVTFTFAQFGSYPASVKARHYRNAQFSADSNTINVSSDPCL